MTAPLPTPGEAEEMRERHVRQEVHCGQHGCDLHCAWCADPWPCDAARLLALVDHEHQHGLAWVATVAERDARLDAVLAECDLLDVARALGHVWTYGQIQERIRRAATGEAT